MTSAAGGTRIPYKHSTTALPRQGPRYATSLPHVAHAQPDVTTSEQGVNPSGCSIRTADTAADTLDSRSQKATSISKFRAHSRLGSLGRIRSRGSVKQQQDPETAPVPVPVPDTRSHKLPEVSTLSNSSSETTLSDDIKSEINPLEKRPSRPSFWLATNNVPSDFTKGVGEFGEGNRYKRLVQQRPRMMHQTSSKLLRMTDDERPFTRVR